MDRDTLSTILGDLADNTLSVKPDGTVCTSDGGEYDADEMLAAIVELEDELSKLRVVAAWAKKAPFAAAEPVTR